MDEICPKIPGFALPKSRDFNPDKRTEIPGLDVLYELYSFRVIPEIGRLVADDAESYRYLVESIRQFPRPEDFAAMIAKAGFSRSQWTAMSGGIVALHSGWRL